MEHDNPEFEKAFGIYVGPATYDEVVAALLGGSELVVRIDNRESPRSEEGIRYRHGWLEHLHEVYEDDGVRDTNSSFTGYSRVDPSSAKSSRRATISGRQPFASTFPVSC